MKGGAAGEEDLSSPAGRARALAQARAVRLEPGSESHAESRLQRLQVEDRIFTIYLAMDATERLQALRDLRCHEPEHPMETTDWSVRVATRRLEFNAAYSCMSPLQRVRTAAEIRDPGALVNLSPERWKRAVSLCEHEWEAAYASLGAAGRLHALEQIRQSPLPRLDRTATHRALLLRTAEFSRLLGTRSVLEARKNLARLRTLDGLVGPGAPVGQSLKDLLLLRYAEMSAIYSVLPEEICAKEFISQSRLSDVDTLDDAAFDVRVRLTTYEAGAAYKRLGGAADLHVVPPDDRLYEMCPGQSPARRNALIVAEFRGYFTRIPQALRLGCLDRLMFLPCQLSAVVSEALRTLREQLLSEAMNLMPAEDRAVVVARMRDPTFLATLKGDALAYALAMRKKAFELWLQAQPREAQLVALEEARKPARLANLSGVPKSRMLDVALNEFRVFNSVLSGEDRASAWARAQRLERLDGCDAARLPDAILLCRTEFMAWYGALPKAKRLKEITQLRERCEGLPAAAQASLQDKRALGVIRAQFEALYGLIPPQERAQALVQARHRPAGEPAEGVMLARRAEFAGAYASMGDGERVAQVEKAWASLTDAFPIDAAASRVGVRLLSEEMEGAARWLSPAAQATLLAGLRTTSGLVGMEPGRFDLAVRMRHAAFTALMRGLSPSELLAALAEARRPDAFDGLHPVAANWLLIARRCEMMAVYQLLPAPQRKQALAQARDTFQDGLDTPEDFGKVKVVHDLREEEFRACLFFVESDARLLANVAYLRQTGWLVGVEGPTLSRMARRRALEIDVAVSYMDESSARTARAQAHDPAALEDAQGPALKAALALCKAQFQFEYRQMTAEQVAAAWERACSPGPLVALADDALARALALRGAEFEALSARMTRIEWQDRQRALLDAGAQPGPTGQEAEVAGRLREVALRALAPYGPLGERWVEQYGEAVPSRA